jgi:hypothetical protein
MFPLAPLRRSTIIAVPGAGVKCGSTRRSSISSLALPNLREERWLCLSLGVLAVTESLWNTPGSKVRPKGAKFRNLHLFLTTKDTKITKKSTEIIVKAFLRAFRVLRGELWINVRPQGAILTRYLRSPLLSAPQLRLWSFLLTSITSGWPR